MTVYQRFTLRLLGAILWRLVNTVPYDPAWAKTTQEHESLISEVRYYMEHPSAFPETE